MDYSGSEINSIMDSSFKKVNYRGLDFYPEFASLSTLDCSAGQFKKGDDGEWQDKNCTNSKGEDMSRSADYTNGLKITYFFR